MANNLFDKIPTNLENEVFEQLVKSYHIRIERIISKGHTSPEFGWYEQKQNEWVIVLKGQAILSFANESSVNLQEGDYINIEAYKKHKVEWTDPNIETIWLAVHY
ncbi:MAG: cupin domain-containing protein [Spirulinaceae cyanobacterium]